MISCLLAYDAAGVVTATLDSMIARDAAGNVLGLVDFGAHEAAGGRLRDIWDVSDAVGSGTWPEWLGGRAHDFRVELQGGRIIALVHRRSRFRRRRAAIEKAIRRAPLVDGSRDLRALLGGPGRPLLVDDRGRTASLAGTPPHLPLIGASDA